MGLIFSAYFIKPSKPFTPEPAVVAVGDAVDGEGVVLGDEVGDVKTGVVADAGNTDRGA
mgnify:CR=1 FL=1